VPLQNLELTRVASYGRPQTSQPRIIQTSAKSRDLHVTRGKRSLTEESGCLKMVLGGEWHPYLR